METLCDGDINADKVFEIKFQNNSDAMSMPLKIDLNSTIRMVTAKPICPTPYCKYQKRLMA
ncbi:hypothetical protein Fmac_001784 [Flemingia macrophylla]|uniref:Uncharacterized protein n=1 Tax=Flemingia macrophylla TaxID=520843 RepID=A0ABD1NI27_9FABA